MAKRFTDTNKYKKTFHRSLPGPYKLLWDFLYHECDHAAIWHVDFEVAQIYLGKDMQVDAAKALELFNAGEERVIVLGSKWFIKSFIEFQYGVSIEQLNPANKVHASVISVLKKEGVFQPLARGLEGAKDKDKDKDKALDKVKEGGPGGDFPTEAAPAPEPTETVTSEPGSSDVNPREEIAAEKAEIAFREFRSVLEKRVNDGVKARIADRITLEIVRALGGLDEVCAMMSRDGPALETAFCERYARRELMEFAKSRPFVPEPLGAAK